MKKATRNGSTAEAVKPSAESTVSTNPRRYPGRSLTLLSETDLVGTDIDTITSSLPTGLQLYAVLPKLVVSIIFLYVLLGWSAFVALGAVSAFVARHTCRRD